MCASLLQVFTKAELEMIADLCKRYDVMCVSDEVYEWLVYSGNKHLKIGEQVFTRYKMYIQCPKLPYNN